MGIATEPDTHMERRALLTDREREVLRGDVNDVENLSQYQSKIRTRLKSRLDRLEDDIALLDDVEPELAADLHERVQRLEEEVEALRSQLDDEE